MKSENPSCPEKECIKDCTKRYGFGFCNFCDKKDKKEKFPSLSNKWLSWWQGELKDYKEIYDLLENKKKIGKEFIPIFIHITDIQETCLDKVKVREVLNGELLMEVKVEETKKAYGIRLIKVIEKELKL